MKRTAQNIFPLLDKHWEAFSEKQRVIIDCGHTRIRAIEAEAILLGAQEQVSRTELETLMLGIRVKEYLEKKGLNEVYLNVTFIDTVPPVNTAHHRAMLKLKIQTGIFLQALAEPYRQVLSPHQSHLLFQLQSANSNRFTGKLKNFKTQFRQDPRARERLFRQAGLFCFYNSDLFSFSLPWLLDAERENQVMKGSWWQDDQCHLKQQDLSRAPFLQIKRNKCIGLYHKRFGISCSGSYCGFLNQFSGNYTHIALYNRVDDPNVGEKIMGGVLADMALFNQPEKHYIQVISGLNPDIVEFSHLHFTELTPKILPDFDGMSQDLAFEFPGFKAFE